MPTTRTLLTIFVHPDEVEHALYHINVTLTEGGTPFTLQRGAEERITLDMAQPFTLTHRQTQLVFALEQPLTHIQIRDLSDEIMTGLIYGFTVKGEVDLGEGIFNNLEGQTSLRKKSDLGIWEEQGNGK